ncbi:MAG TPA: hypothetical protein VJZ00_16765 [Thermoanaerobaculia bacterium]|nr:hypothetical protein [Thermoanaerobaculia bacterium]
MRKRWPLLLLLAMAATRVFAQTIRPNYVLTANEVLRVDLAAGTSVPVASLPLITSEIAAYDPLRHRVTYASLSFPGERLVTVALSGTFPTTVVTVTGPDLAGLEYDAATGALYALQAIPGAPLVRVRADGNTDLVAVTGSIAPLVAPGAFTPSAFDPATGRYFFISGAQTLDAQILVTVNVNTHVVTMLPVPFTGFYSTLTFDRITTHLLATRIHGGTFLVELDPVTGSTTQIAASALRLFGHASYLDAARRTLYINTFPPDGLFFGAIDVTNGNMVVRPSPGLAEIAPAAAPATDTEIPALDARALLLLIAALATVAVFCVGKVCEG